MRNLQLCEVPYPSPLHLLSSWPNLLKAHGHFSRERHRPQLGSAAGAAAEKGQPALPAGPESDDLEPATAGTRGRVPDARPHFLAVDGGFKRDLSVEVV